VGGGFADIGAAVAGVSGDALDTGTEAVVPLHGHAEQLCVGHDQP
jgi:hypothetical protein